MSIYAIGKEDQKVHFTCSNKQNLDIMMDQAKVDPSDYIILQEFDMKCVSRITYIDGLCIYNSKEYWTKTSIENPITKENYSEHEILDFLGNPVTYDRYVDERNYNQTRLAAIDGRAGEVEHNMAVGSEIISLLREECIDCGHGNVSPESMLVKASQIIIALMAGCFREVQGMLDTMERDEFFTDERIEKYQAMIASADVITYDPE